MKIRRDLYALLDAVADHAARVEIVVDNRLELSIAATVHTDLMGDARAAITRHHIDSMAAALELALVDAASWVNAQPGHKRPIAIGTVAPTLDVITALRALVGAFIVEGTTGNMTVLPEPLLHALERGKAALAAVGVQS